nr:ATPase [Roseobacter sp.]
SQWRDGQVLGLEREAKTRRGRSEAGEPFGKRVAFVAMGRAEERLLWVVRNRLSMPSAPLTTADLVVPAPKLELEAEEEL